MEKEPCAKFCGALINSHEVMKLKSFESSVMDVIPTNMQNISFVIFFANIWLMIKLCLDVSDVIHANEHAYANCGLHVNSWRL